MNKKQVKEQVENVAKSDLLDIIDKDTKLIIIIKSVSNSGMSRRMCVLANNIDITYSVGKLCDLSYNNAGLLVKGCGMDMAFWLVMCITNCLYGTEHNKDNTRPKWLKGNGGTCLEWLTV